MKKKSVNIVLFVILFPVLLQAQNLNQNMFMPGWFAGADAGVNVVMAENFLGHFPSSALGGSGGTLRLQAGYRFTNVFSVRSVAGFASSIWYNKKNNSVAFNSEYGAIDLKFDLLQFVADYKTGQRFSAGLFSGAGFLNRNKITVAQKYLKSTESAFLPLLRFGGAIDYHAGKSVVFFINGELNFTGDKLNGYEAGKRAYDILPVITFGIVYDFRPKLKGKWEY